MPSKVAPALKRAAPPHKQGEMSRLWHEAGMAYSRNDISGARETYRALISASSLRQSSSAAWYRSMAEFGIARTSSRLQDTLETRSALLRAFKQEFWNFDAIERDTIMRNVAGASWVDSLVSVYQVVRKISTATWQVQQPIVVVPATSRAFREYAMRVLPQVRLPATASGIQALDSASRSAIRRMQHIPLDEFRATYGIEEQRPLIVALHGGCASYHEFARHWGRIADSLGVFVLVPAGNARLSADMNSWDGEIDTVDAAISATLTKFERVAGYIPETHIAGFSQGAMAAIKLAVMHPDRYHGVVAIAGLLDRPLPQELLNSAAATGLAVFAMSGEFDSPTFRATLEQAGRQCLTAHVPFRLDILPDVVHEVPSDFAERFSEAWDWLHIANSATTQSYLNRNVR